jgi:hypothetical protein
LRNVREQLVTAVVVQVVALEVGLQAGVGVELVDCEARRQAQRHGSEQHVLQAVLVYVADCRAHAVVHGIHDHV